MAFDILKSRGVSRLCHFTKLQKLAHILSSEDGILASQSIRSDIKDVTDIARYDGELDYVCCSIEYPNSWFLNKAMGDNADGVFREWVVLYIDLGILKNKKAKFCPCNASKSRGAYIDSNMKKVASIFEMRVPTFKYPRTPEMLSCCPTDGQAEILLKDNVPKNYIKSIAVGNENTAKITSAMIKTLSIKALPIFIAPSILTSEWSRAIKAGNRPDEILCDWKEEV